MVGQGFTGFGDWGSRRSRSRIQGQEDFLLRDKLCSRNLAKSGFQYLSVTFVCWGGGGGGGGGSLKSGL